MSGISFQIDEHLLDDMLEYSDSSFDIGSSIEYSKNILQEEMNKHSLSKCYFEDNHWTLYRSIGSAQTHLYFNSLEEAVQFNTTIYSSEFINILKCWTASLIESYNDQTVKSYHRGLVKFLILTKGLSSLNINDISDDFTIMSEGEKKDITNSALNLFDYYSDLDINEEILSLLYEFKKRTNVEKNARIIPPSKDILIFLKVVDDYFFPTISEPEYYKYFSVWLWWRLTNIIPIRPGEFCDIPRDCLSESNGNYYIQLPRKKQKSKNIQVMDKIYVPKEIYYEVKKYKEQTEVYGETKTLISYLSLPDERNKDNKVDPLRFTNPIFSRILRNFYEEIVFGRYPIEFNPTKSDDIDLKTISRMLKPGDTRHIAFINMKRQGYHPVEIARAGGHTSLQSQHHYFNHIQNYVDLEILELITNTDLDSDSNKMLDTDAESSIHSFGTSFINDYVLKPPKTDFKRKMDDGYCTDPEQRCMDEDCWKCDHWRISMQEFIQKQPILEQKMVDSKSKLNEVIDNLKNVYKAIYENMSDEYYSSDNPEIRKQLINRSKYIDNAIHKYVNLYKVKERIDYIGNKGQETKNLTTTRD